MNQDVGSGVFVGVLNKGRTLAGSGQGVRCGIRSVFWGIEQEQDRPNFRGRERVVGSRLFAGGLNKRQDSACFSAGTEMWAQVYVLGESNKGKTQTGSCAGQEIWAQQCLPGS